MFKSLRTDLVREIPAAAAAVHSRNFRLPICCQTIKIEMHRNIILSVFLCGCENWFLKLKENIKGCHE